MKIVRPKRQVEGSLAKSLLDGDGLVTDVTAGSMVTELPVAAHTSAVGG